MATEMKNMASGFNKKKELVEGVIEDKKSVAIATTEEKTAEEAAARVAFNQAASDARDANLAANLAKQAEILSTVRDAADAVVGDENSTEGNVSTLYQLEELIQDNYGDWIAEKAAVEGRLAQKREDISTAFGQVSDYVDVNATVPSITVLV